MNLEKLKEQARRHEQKEEWSKALELYEKAIRKLQEEEQPDIGVFNRAGDIQARIGNLEAAVKHYERACELYLEAELPNNAIAVCKKVLRNLPARATAYLRMGQIRASQGFLTDARQNFLAYAELMQEAGEMEEAFRALIEFIDLAPHDMDIRAGVAAQLASHGNVSEAVEQLTVIYRHRMREGLEEAAGQIRDQILELDPEAEIPTDFGPPPEKEDAAGGLAIESTSLGGEVPEQAEVEDGDEEGDEDFEFGEIEIASDGDGDGPEGAVAAAEGAGLEDGGDALGDDFAIESAEPAGDDFAIDGELEVAGGDGDLELEADVEGDIELEGDIGGDLELITPDPPDDDEDAFEAVSVDAASESDAGDEDFRIEAADDATVDGESDDDEDDIDVDLPLMSFDDDEAPSEGDRLEEGAALHLEAADAEGRGVGDPDAGELDVRDLDGGELDVGELDVGELDLGELDAADLEPGEPDVDDLDLGEPDADDLDPGEADANAPDEDEGEAGARDDFEALRLEGEGLLEAGKREEGLEALRRAHEGLAAEGSMDRAMRIVREVILHDPDRPAHHQTLVEYAYRADDRTLLIPAFLDLAECLARVGDTAKAKAVFDQVLIVDPGNRKAAAGLAEVSDAPALDPPLDGDGEPDGTGDDGTDADRTGEDETAVAAGGGKSPGSSSPGASGGDGEGFLDLGSMVLDGEEKRTTRWRVSAEAPSGDEEADFRRLLSQFKAKVAQNVSQDDYKAHYDLGTAYKEMGLLEEAIAQFQQALRATGGDLATYEMLGQCFLEGGQHEVALRTLKRALEVPWEVEDDLLGIYYHLARAFEVVNDTEQAVEFYEKVFSLDINFMDVTERLRALRP